MDLFGVELELDLLDADQLEVYEKEMERVQRRAQDPTQYEGKSTSDSLRLQCRIIDDFFDAVFGQGTAKAIFHGKNNIKEHMMAFETVAGASAQARQELDNLMQK